MTMILQVYSVYDKAVGAYLPPFFLRSKGEALRSFSEACNDEKHMFHKNSADYVLYLVAIWDDSSGLFTGGESQRILSADEALIRSPD